jgi:hypothetical protein
MKRRELLKLGAVVGATAVVAPQDLYAHPHKEAAKQFVEPMYAGVKLKEHVRCVLAQADVTVAKDVNPHRVYNMAVRNLWDEVPGINACQREPMGETIQFSQSEIAAAVNGLDYDRDGVVGFRDIQTGMMQRFENRGTGIVPESLGGSCTRTKAYECNVDLERRVQK